MPFLRIETNVSQDKVPANFLIECTKLLAKTLQKPESYCSVGIVPGMLLLFGGTSDPCAYVTIMSIGRLGVEENKGHAKVIFDKLQKDLGLDHKRVYITFQDAPSSTIGYDGTTCQELFGN